MDLVPEHHPSSVPKGENGPTGHNPPSQNQPHPAAEPQNPPTNPSQPPPPPKIADEERTNAPLLATSAESPAETLMGPGQPGTQAPGSTPSLPQLEGLTDSALPNIGPHAAISSSSAFNMFEPPAPDDTETRVIQSIKPADDFLIRQRLDELRGSTNGILAGVTNYYNREQLIASRDREGNFPLCDETTLNSAFRIVMIALDSGFPPEPAALNPPIFEGSNWFRAANTILAAVGRGMIRSTPDQLKRAANNPPSWENAHFQLPPKIIPPESDGELSQCLAEHIAGMVNFRNDLHLDANPYTYFDLLKEKAKPLLEEGATLQAQVDAEAWQRQLTAQLKSAGFEKLMSDLQKELNDNPFTTDRQQSLKNEILAQAGNLKKQVLDQAREAMRRDCAAEAKAVAEQEQAAIYKEELERVTREVSRDVNQEVRNWRISYREKKEQEFQATIDAEVKASNIAAIVQAAKELGLKPLDFRNPQGSGEKAHKPNHPLSGGPSPPLAGAKRTASGSMPPLGPTPGPAPPMEVVQEEASSARTTRSQSRNRGRPGAAPSEIVQPDSPTPFVSGVAQSMHNPANQMAVDSATPPQSDPNEGPLAAIQSMLTTLTARIEQVASMVEGPNYRALPTPKTGPSMSTPAGQRAPPQGNRAPRVDIPRPMNPDDGFIQTDPLRRAWNNVTAQGIAQQTEAKNNATRAAVTQGRNQAGRAATKSAPRNLPLNTEVTVLRDGGLTEQAAEAAVRAQRPDNVVREVQKQINTQVKNNPIQILAGRWSGSVKRTGNFIFTIRGQVSFPLIASYSRFLLAPFPGSELAPSGNWTWAQLRGVPIWNEEDIAHSQEELLKELRANPAFETAIITTPPRWQVPVERLTGDTGTVVFSYCDPDESITRQAREDHVFLFGSYAKFTLSPSRPALIQCSRCHQLGHARNSKACRVPADALICFKCGGPHRSEHHTRECRRVHRDVGICDCPPKCILCSNTGHHARDQKCPKRAEFAPPRASNCPQPNPRAPRQDNAGINQEGWTTVGGGKKRSRVPARPAYRGAGGGKGKQPPPPSPASEHARIDDAASEMQVEQSLWMDYDYAEEEDRTPGQGWDSTYDDNMSINGTRRNSHQVPRNATPGPSNA